MYEVRYTENAERDLDEIADYIAQYNLENAILFITELENSFYKVLSVFPNGGYLYNKSKGIRMTSHKGYTAFYHIKNEIVEVLHVVNLEKPISVSKYQFLITSSAFGKRLIQITHPPLFLHFYLWLKSKK